jgi:hypothetical protein
MLLISGEKSSAVKSLTLEIRVEALFVTDSYCGMAIRGYPIDQKPTDRRSDHTSQSTETFARLNLTSLASIHNAICATNGARNGNFLFKTGPICVVGSVGQHLSRTHLSA